MTQIDISYSWIGSISLIKMTILSKAICRFNAIPVKLPVVCFTELEYNILMSVWRHQRLNGQTILRKKNKARVLRLSVFKLLFHCSIFQFLCQWHKIFLIVALYNSSLKTESLSTLALFFFLKIVWPFSL